MPNLECYEEMRRLSMEGLAAIVNRHSRPEDATASVEAVITYVSWLTGARPLRSRIDPHYRALRQPEAGTLQAAVERLEGGKTFDPKTEAADKFSRIFQDPTAQSFAESEDPARNPRQVTDSLRDGRLVPVRGFEPRSRG